MSDPVIPIRREPERPHVALHDRAMDNLQYIRDTMARSAEFTAISGGSMILMGGIALFAAILSTPAEPLAWSATWLGAAVLSFSVSTLATSYKAKQIGEKLLAGPGRKFLLGMLPALAVGGLLTLPMLRVGATELLPGIWMLLYGIAITAGGVFSVRTIPTMGVSFILLGTVAVLLPGLGANLWMGIGFGALHIIFGAWIARRHGG